MTRTSKATTMASLYNIQLLCRHLHFLLRLFRMTQTQFRHRTSTQILPWKPRKKTIFFRKKGAKKELACGKSSLGRVAIKEKILIIAGSFVLGSKALVEVMLTWMQTVMLQTMMVTMVV